MILTWHVTGTLSQTDVVREKFGPEYTLDKDYKPVRLILRLKEAPAASGASLTVDVNVRNTRTDDPVSIFQTDKPWLGYDNTEIIYEGEGLFTNKLLTKDSVITLDIDQVSPANPGKDLTVQLDLEEL